MRLPDKVTIYDDSILACFEPILRTLQHGNMTAPTLYDKVKRSLREDIGLFVEALDCLFALGKVDFADGTEELIYVAGDSIA